MKQLLLFLCLLLSAAAIAAPADYVVYYVKGTVRKGSSRTPLRRGDSLLVSDAVYLSEGAILYLVCRDYSLIQFKKGGSYKLREAAPCPGKPASLTASYFKYVWDELRTHHDAPEQNPRHFMRNKGAVSRSGCPMIRTALYVDTIYAAGGNLQLYWSAAIGEPWLSTFADATDTKPVKQLPLKAGKPIELKDVIALADEAGAVYWSITEKTTQGCDRKYLQVLPAAEYKARVNALLQQVLPTTAAETAYMKAFILEENHFLIEAIKYYAESFRLDPANPRTKAALNHYHEIN